MNDDRMADLLGLVDNDEPLDDDARQFKARLRAELGEVFDGAGDLDPIRLEPARVEHASRSTGRPIWAAAAAIVVVVAGVAFVQLSRDEAGDPAPVAEQPATAATSVAPEPVVAPAAACQRFRETSAADILTGRVRSDITSDDLAVAVDAVELLLGDVRAHDPDALLLDPLGRAAGALREARIRLEAGTDTDMTAALEFARVELAAAVIDPEFENCFR